MRINKIGIAQVAFKSVRTDKNTVAQLKTGEKPLIDNNKQNIYAALNNMSARAERDNIEFLLDIADNLAYGQGGKDSEFKTILDKDGITPEKRENTDWNELLKDTIKKALSLSKDDNKDLEAEYKRIFKQERPLNDKQKKLLDLRQTLTQAVLKEAIPEDIETLTRVAQVRKNLDYFTASSEIPANQKQECLEKFITFMSDEYKINPQLAELKLQVLDEMLNDLVIKTPENEVLTIKDVDQRQSGMCAAISICRKAMAYEDKSRFVDLIMEELNDSPVMSVYDVTELGTGKKVEIPKTNVDFNAELAQGYRIIDASAHHWMHNAHASGNGLIMTEYYYAPSDDEYGIFDDSSWYMGLNSRLEEMKPLLMALIKEKEFIESYLKNQKAMKESQQNLLEIKKQTQKTQANAIGKLNSLMAQIFPQKTDAENTALIKKLIEFYKGSTSENEINISNKHSEDLKRDIVIGYMDSIVSDMSESERTSLKESAQKIFDMLDTYIQSDEQLKHLKRFSTPRSKYILNKKLYNIAAAHRCARVEDVNLPDGIMRYEKLVGLPPRQIQVSQVFTKLSKNVEPDKQKELVSDMFIAESKIPSDINSVLKTIIGKDIREVLIDVYNELSNNVEQCDSDTINDLIIHGSLGSDKNEILKKLNKVRSALEADDSEYLIGDAVRSLGYEDKFQFVKVYLSSFISSMQQGITEDQYQLLAERFGGEDKIEYTINSQLKKFEKLQKTYDSILKKWQIPTARELIIEKLEREKDILSINKLNMLKSHFDYIQSQINKNDTIQNTKKRTQANEELYRFSEDEEEIFNSISKNMQSMKKYSKMSYNALNKLLHDDLEAQYANIGMLNGQFWVREEGSSGLTANEQIRIIEQMTGKPYHAENDVKLAAQEIKEGNGSGIISLSVTDDDYGFHAQYIPAVTSETFTNPISKEKTVDDVIWTDNSWGRSEKQYYWNGQNGHIYTDYGHGYGWHDGFILSPSNTIGLKVDDIFGALGHAKSDDGESFGLFSDVILPGKPKNTYHKLAKMYNQIFTVDEGETIYKKLEDALSKGDKINLKQLESLDQLSESKEEKLISRIKKEIHSKEDFDKLAPDDELRLVFEKMSVFMFLHKNNPAMEESVYLFEDLDDINDFKQDYFNDMLDDFAAIIGKSAGTVGYIKDVAYEEFFDLAKDTQAQYKVKISEKSLQYILNGILYNNVDATGTLDELEQNLINNVRSAAMKHIKNPEALEYFVPRAQKIISKTIDEQIRIKSFDTPILANSPVKDKFIDVIDKYLEPNSQEELLTLISQMQNVNSTKLDSFFDAIEMEDLGITFKDPYDYIKLYKTDDTEILKAFSDIVSTQTINENFGSCINSDTPQDLYRDLYVKLSYLDVQKFVKSYKAEAFQKYKVRQAFPEPIVLSHDAIRYTVNQMVKTLRQSVNEIDNNKYVIKFMSLYDKLNQNYSKKYFYKTLLEKKDVHITSSNAPLIQGFTQSLEELYQLIENDDTIENINSNLKNLIDELHNSESVIDGKKAGMYLKALKEEFDNYQNSNLNTEHFTQIYKEALKEIKSKIKLYVDANFDPKYKDDAVKKLNTIVKLIRKETPEEDINYETELFAELLEEKHIVNNPSALLRECSEYLMQGKQNTDEYSILRDYLITALRVAHQTKLQYKLVQNQHEGISSKFKDIISAFSINMQDGTSKPIKSPEGMLYLIQQLKNTDDKNVILNLFLNQTGLNSEALNALIDNFELDKSKVIMEDTINEISDSISQLNKIIEYSDKFLSQSDMKQGSIKNIIDNLLKYIKRQHKDGVKGNIMLQKYIDYMSYVKDSQDMNDIVPAMYPSVIRTLNMEALNALSEMINAKMDFLDEIERLLNERVDLIDSIDIPQDSQDDEKREKFIDEYDKFIEYITAKENIMNANLTASNNLMQVTV